VAVKVISVDEDGEDMSSTMREIEFLKDCSHPNVVQYKGSYVKDGKLWIAMEFCAGGSIADIMEITTQPLSEDQIAVICREALKVCDCYFGLIGRGWLICTP
jgi:serine/threonine protein kinase